MIKITSKAGTVACSIAADSKAEVIADAVLAAYGCCKVVSEHMEISKPTAVLFIMQQLQQYLAKGGNESE